MNVEFRTKTGKRIGSTTLASGVGSLTLMALSVLFVFTEERNAVLTILQIGKAFDYDIAWPSNVPLYTVKLMAFVPGAVSILLAWNAIGRGVLNWVRESPIVAVRSAQELLRKKLEEELQSFPNTYQDNFQDQLTKAQGDERRLVTANRLGMIENPKVWECHWPRIDQLPVAARRFREVEPTIPELRASLNEAVDRLRNFVASRGRSILFLVSPVQPAILRAATVVAKAAGGDLISIRSSTTTGPETVRDAVSARRDSLSGGNGGLVFFAAPLSAFCLAPAEPGAPSATEQFQPVCCLAIERQDLLAVEAGSSLPIRKETIFYYENSSAEEFIAGLEVKALEVVNLEPIDSFDEYKRLLNGTTRSGQPRLQPGDAIVTWPPLTKAFDGKGTSAGGYFRIDDSLAKAPLESRIMLFADDRSLKDPVPDGPWCFVECLVKQLLLMKLEHRKGSWTDGSDELDREFVDRFAPFYERLVQ